MAVGKYSRVDGRKSTNYCSTVTLVVFVGLCLVGVWMLMSSSVVPVQNTELSSQDPKEDIREKVTDKFSSRIDDNSGEQAEDAGKEESKPTTSGEESNPDVSDTQNSSDKVSDDNAKTQEEKTEESSEVSSNDNEDSKKEGEGQGAEQPKGDAESNPGSEESKSGSKESNTDNETNADGQSESENEKSDTISNPNEGGKKPETEESVEETKNKTEEKVQEQLPAAAQSEILKETTTETGAWSTQAAESESEKKSQKSKSSKGPSDYNWKVCNVTAGPDYIPCLDNLLAISKLPNRDHYQHRERHCPDEAPTCLVSLPEGYRQSVKWPKSREQIWYYNVPHTKLAEVKGHQNWVKVSGDHLTFPGGGTQFIHGALHYIDNIQQSLPDIAWGKRSRVILDVGCSGQPRGLSF